MIECESIEYLAEQKVDLAMEMLKWVTAQQIIFTILHFVCLRGRWVTDNGKQPDVKHLSHIVRSCLNR